MRGWFASLIQWAWREEDSWGQEFVTQQIDTITTVGEIMSGVSSAALGQLAPDSQERLARWLDEKFPQGEVIPLGVFRDE